jgi:hypothetical protein
MGYRDRDSSSLLDATCTYASRTNAHLLARAVHQRANLAQIGIPTAAPGVVRMTDDISILRAFAANFTSLGHKGRSNQTVQ